MLNAAKFMIIFDQIPSYCVTYKVMAVGSVKVTIICAASAVLKPVFDSERTKLLRLF
jgi:hypothetical protein